MSLYKRKKSWWICFTTPNGQRIRCSAGTNNKSEAQEYHDRLKTKHWDVHRLGHKPERSWQEATTKFIGETKHKASHSRDLIYLRWLDPYLRNKALSEINREMVDFITERRLSEGVANATVNRLLACLRSILRKAMNDWGWINQTPKFRMLPEPTLRVRWLKPEEAKRLIQALPEHQAYAVRFALATGLRQGNIRTLEWSQVSLERSVCWIYADQAKAGKPIHVPLNSEVIAVLKALEGKHPDSVFTYRGKPIGQLTTKAWYRALKKAGIKSFRWHDLRHTWASWHVQNGTPIAVLQELGAWKSTEMVRRYAHLGQTHLAKYSENSCQIE